MVTKKSKREKREIKYSDAKGFAEDYGKNFKPTTYKVPKGVKTFRFEEAKTYGIDFLPHIVGKRNPNKKKGEVHFECTMWVHPRLGPEGQPFTCNRKSIGPKEKCAACSRRAMLAKKSTGDEDDPYKDEIDALKPQQRQLFYIKLAKKPKITYIVDQAYFGKGFGFGEFINETLDAMKKGDKRLNFFHLEGGFTANIRMKGSKFLGRTFYRPTNIEFVKRENDYEESLLDELPALDSLIIPADQDELKEAIEGLADSDDKKGRKKGKKKGKSKDEDEEEDDDVEEDEEEDEEDSDEETDEDEGEDEDDSDDDKDEETASDLGIEVGSTVKHKKHGECEVVHVSGDGTSLRIKDDDDEVHRAIAPSDVTLVDSEDKDEDKDEDEKPKKKGKKKPARKAKKKKDEDDDDEDEDEGEDETDEDEDKDSEDEDETEDDEEDSSGEDSDEDDSDEDDDSEDDDEDEDEDEEEEEKPKKKGKKKKSKKSDDEDEIPFDEEEEDEEEEDEKPKNKKKGKK